MDTLILVIIGIVVGPILGGLIAGLDRRVTAWFQSRQGPPIMQAFYDVAKLFGKEKWSSTSGRFSAPGCT